MAVLLTAVWVAFLTAATWPHPVHADPPPIPYLAQWESQMTKYGEQHCNYLKDRSRSGAERLGATYYDGERIYYQIWAYTKDPKWLTCAEAAEDAYRDGYVLANNGKVAGWMIFPHGLLRDFQETGDTHSQDALIRMSRNAAYGTPGFGLGALSDPKYSREVAYNLMCKILAERMGSPYDYSADITRLAEEAFRHMDAWFVTKTAPYVRPFMVALTSEALITYYGKTQDSRVLPILRTAADYLWDHAWLPNDQAFMYTDRASNDNSGGMTPAVDLNLLIAPVYAWLYMQTGDTKYQERGDQAFAGAVKKGPTFLFYAKQYDQNYRWSFDYVTWRSQGARVAASPTSAPPQPSEPAAPPAPPAPSNGPSRVEPPSSPPSGPRSIVTNDQAEPTPDPDKPRGMIKKKRR